MIKSLIERLRFWSAADRIGPDMPLTHWQLHFPSLMRRQCLKKFHRFGKGAEFRPGAYAVCCSRISLGKRVIIRPGTMLFADPRSNDVCIDIEDDVMLGSGVHIYVANHEFSDLDVPIIDQGHRPCKPVSLRTGCWIGANAIILPGVTIGRNSVVAAGSVVTRSVPDGCICAGVPARVIKSTKMAGVSKDAS